MKADRKLQHPKWEDTGAAILVHCKSEVEAIARLMNERDRWSFLAAEFDHPVAYLKFPGCKGNGIGIKAAAEPGEKAKQEVRSMYSSVLTGLHSHNLPLSKGILEALETIATSPNERWFLHKLAPNLNDSTQIALTESCKDLIVGATPQQAVNRKRSDYTHPEDLGDVVRSLRTLEPGNKQSAIELHWRMFSPVTGANWRYNTANYRIVDQIGGDVFVLSQTLECVAIRTPVPT